jgi:hypothetical protein
MKRSEFQRLVQRFTELKNTASVTEIAQRSLNKIAVFSAYPFMKLALAKKQFTVFGKALPMFIHHYNATWRNERAVEIAAALAFLGEHQNKRLLEVGNVLSYYTQTSHIVIDKYEKSPEVLNTDFLTYRPEQPFDGLISISTFEHIGWDEQPKEPEKIKRAFARISDLVKNPDLVFVTVPVGYNDYLDQLIRDDLLPFKNQEFLVRLNRENDWRASSRNDALEHKYNRKFPAANALLIAQGLKV